MYVFYLINITNVNNISDFSKSNIMVCFMYFVISKYKSDLNVEFFPSVKSCFNLMLISLISNYYMNLLIA